MTTTISDKPTKFHDEKQRVEWRTPRQVAIDQAVATWAHEAGTPDHDKMAREMWDKANESAELIQNALSVVSHHERQVLTVVTARRTVRETLRATLIALGVSHHHEANIRSLIDEVSERTGWKPVSDIALLELCPDSRRVYFTPEHDPELTARQAFDDARALTDIMREALR